LAARRGWDVDALLRSAGIAPSLLTAERSRVTTEQVDAVFKTLLRATHDELLGLGSAPVAPGTFRMLGYALLGAADLNEAFYRLRSFRRAVPGIPPLRLTKAGAAATLMVDTSDIGYPLDVLVDTFLAAAHRLMGWATNSRIQLQRIELPHPHQPNVDDYGIIFGAPVTFGAARAALVFRSAVLFSPIMRSPAEWDGFLRNSTAEILSRRDYSVSVGDRVRRIVEQGLDGSWPTAEDVADRLAMSPQTVRRKLREEGTSFSQIREDILRDAAIIRLTSGEETVAVLSEQLGFSEPSAFTRAFRRWTGTSPGAYRLGTPPP
jgi:AraC-like DNA-binding protein